LIYFFCIIAEAPKKKTLFKSNAHESKPKKAPKKAAPKKRSVSDSDEDMFALPSKKVCWSCYHSYVIEALF
jgi:hypothetical protein